MASQRHLIVPIVKPERLEAGEHRKATEKEERAPGRPRRKRRCTCMKVFMLLFWLVLVSVTASVLVLVLAPSLERARISMVRRVLSSVAPDLHVRLRSVNLFELRAEELSYESGGSVILTIESVLIRQSLTDLLRFLSGRLTLDLVAVQGMVLGDSLDSQSGDGSTHLQQDNVESQSAHADFAFPCYGGLPDVHVNRVTFELAPVQDEDISLSFDGKLATRGASLEAAGVIRASSVLRNFSAGIRGTYELCSSLILCCAQMRRYVGSACAHALSLGLAELLYGLYRADENLLDSELHCAAADDRGARSGHTFGGLSRSSAGQVAGRCFAVLPSGAELLDAIIEMTLDGELLVNLAAGADLRTQSLATALLVADPGMRTSDACLALPGAGRGVLWHHAAGKGGLFCAATMTPGVSSSRCECTNALPFYYQPDGAEITGTDGIGSLSLLLTEQNLSGTAAWLSSTVSAAMDYSPPGLRLSARDTNGQMVLDAELDYDPITGAVSFQSNQDGQLSNLLSGTPFVSRFKFGLSSGKLSLRNNALVWEAPLAYASTSELFQPYVVLENVTLTGAVYLIFFFTDSAHVTR